MHLVVEHGAVKVEWMQYCSERAARKKKGERGASEEHLERWDQ